MLNLCTHLQNVSFSELHTVSNVFSLKLALTCFNTLIYLEFLKYKPPLSIQFCVKTPSECSSYRGRPLEPLHHFFTFCSVRVKTKGLRGVCAGGSHWRMPLDFLHFPFSVSSEMVPEGPLNIAAGYTEWTLVW